MTPNKKPAFGQAPLKINTFSMGLGLVAGVLLGKDLS
jgi:hypothetical protein